MITLRFDWRIKVLIGVALAGLFSVLGYTGWFFWATNVRAQFGDPMTWPEHVSDMNNIAFHYPAEDFDVIVPEDQAQNPVSIVLKGERGESVLIQVGTWQADKQFANTDELAVRYQAAVSRRKTLSTEKFTVDGREGILFVQDEPSGRRIIESFLLDGPEGFSGLVPREISLQLPGTATSIERSLYEKMFRGLLASVHFLGGMSEIAANRTDSVPEGWQELTATKGNYALWYPQDWGVSSETGGNGQMYSVSFAPKTETEHYGSGKEKTAVIVHALPVVENVSLAELNERYGDPARKTAIEGMTTEERVGIPGVGLGISLETRQATKSGERFELDVLMLVETDVDESGFSPQTDPRGRGYIIYFRSSETDLGQYIETARSIIRSFHFLK